MKINNALLVALVAVFSVAPTLARAEAPSTSVCMPGVEMTQPEREQYILFNSRLSWLEGFHGRPDFEKRLNNILQKSWPKVQAYQVTPLFLERAATLVEIERLRNLIALSIGESHPTWGPFRDILRSVTLHEASGRSLVHPLDRTVKDLMQALQGARIPSTTENPDLVRSEAILRVANMNAYILRWRVINDQLSVERARRDMKRTAVQALAMAGVAVGIATTIYSGGLLSAAGGAVAGKFASAALNEVAVVAAETAAGGALGAVGAPAGKAVLDAHDMLARADIESQTKGTSMACELDQRVAAWVRTAPKEYLHTAIKGGAVGLGAGLAFGNIPAKTVLALTVVGVFGAEAKNIKDSAVAHYQSFAHYQLAIDAEARGDLKKSRDELAISLELAREGNEKALESILVGVLAGHIGAHAKHALEKGASSIRALYASSADTLPMAASAIPGLGSSAAH